MYEWSKCEESVPFGYLEAELNATGEYLFLCSIMLEYIDHVLICTTAFSRFSQHVTTEQF